MYLEVSVFLSKTNDIVHLGQFIINRFYFYALAQKDYFAMAFI